MNKCSSQVKHNHTRDRGILVLRKKKKYGIKCTRPDDTSPRIRKARCVQIQHPTVPLLFNKSLTQGATLGALKKIIINITPTFFLRDKKK